MESQLIRQRDETIKLADQAVAAAWPERKGDAYVRTMLQAVHTLENIANEMKRERGDPLEQSRTYRQLGTLYADLEPALGPQMLLKAKVTYESAESLLQRHTDELERAKLNFNFANALRLIDANDVPALQEAKRRLLDARSYFSANAPQYLNQTDAALHSVEGLLSLAPLANAVQKNTRDMSTLQEELAAGGDAGEIFAQAKEIMKRGGGVAGVTAQLQTIVDTLPPEMKQSKKFETVQSQMQAITSQVLGAQEVPDDAKRIASVLEDHLAAEAGASVSKDHAETLLNVLADFMKAMSGKEETADELIAKAQRMREVINSRFEMNHYLSHGIPRPPAGSRAAELVELNWVLRRYLLEEMNRPEKGEEESRQCLELNVRNNRIDKRIYEAGSQDAVANSMEKEELRPFALAVRNFSARANCMPAQPIWHSAKVAVDTDAVFYSGPQPGRRFVAASCRRSGLELLPEPVAESYATARWAQMQRGFISVFDISAADGPERAAVTYEFGVALALGKPAVVLVAKGQRLPFDVDLDPVVIRDDDEFQAELARALDRAAAWTLSRPLSAAVSGTLAEVLSSYGTTRRDTYVNQSLKLVEELSKQANPDPLSVTQVLSKLIDYMNDGKTQLIHPRWPPAYPDRKNRRLFHVMPFTAEFEDAKSTTQDACKAAGAVYIRGDELEEPDVIRSIWDEIARATHVLVDLSGFNANVALELGIAHTLGKPVLMVGVGDTVDRLFPAIRRRRAKSYNIKDLKLTLGTAVREFLLS